MGVLIDGKWTDGELPQETSETGQFKRVDSSFRSRVTADGSSGFKAEAGRYHLYVAHGCPWAHRTLIYRALKGLEGIISVAYSIPGLRTEGWTYEDDPRYPDCVPDKVNGVHYLHEAYTASNPDYTGKVTVPMLWDKKTRRIVNNESSEIIRMLNSAFDGITGNRADYYPPALRAEIDAVNERVYRNVNNGVYRAGFAKSQQAYDEAYDGLFATLDWLEERLSRQRYLVGNRITEADWRLFPSLVRFDAIYYVAYKCNLRRLDEYPNLSGFLRELYQTPGIAAACDIAGMKRGVYSKAGPVGGNGIVPVGPVVDLTRPHDRDRFAS
ncbi:MAG: glutathione S-transferase family protein [Rhizobiales bacterium]|nr:glutathione S-transferase family protein [Hyphomicrobiales bacterium]